MDHKLIEAFNCEFTNINDSLLDMARALSEP